MSNTVDVYPLNQAVGIRSTSQLNRHRTLLCLCYTENIVQRFPHIYTVFHANYCISEVNLIKKILDVFQPRRRWQRTSPRKNCAWHTQPGSTGKNLWPQIAQCCAQNRPFVFHQRACDIKLTDKCEPVSNRLIHKSMKRSFHYIV